MAKLDKKTRKAVNKAEANHGGGGSFELIPAGKYVATLTGVDDTPGNFGPRWSAEFSDIMSLKGKQFPGRQWLNLDLPQDEDEVPADYVPYDPKKGSPAEQWALQQQRRTGLLKGFFESLGYSEDSDTDEMVEDEAKALIIISQRTFQKGARKGEKFNTITGIQALPEDLDLDDLATNEDDDEGDF